MVIIAFFMVFAVFDPSLLTLCINCSFFYIYAVYNCLGIPIVVHTFAVCLWFTFQQIKYYMMP